MHNLPGGGLVASLSPVQLCATPRTIAHQVPLSMGISTQEFWSGLTFPSPRDIPDPGMEPMSPASPELAGRFFSSFHKLA